MVDAVAVLPESVGGDDQGGVADDGWERLADPAGQDADVLESVHDLAAWLAVTREVQGVDAGGQLGERSGAGWCGGWRGGSHDMVGWGQSPRPAVMFLATSTRHTSRRSRAIQSNVASSGWVPNSSRNWRTLRKIVARCQPPLSS